MTDVRRSVASRLEPALAIFDVGGTTIADSADVAAIFASALAEHGLPPARQEIQRWRGAAKRDVIAHLVAEHGGADPREVYATFQHNLVRALRTAGVQPIAGAEAAFAALRKRGVQVVLTTGFDWEVMAVVLESLPWLAGTDGVVTADDVPAGRPAPDMIHAAMARAGVDEPLAVLNVGDTTNDLLAGSRAGVGLNVGVLTGAHSRAELETVSHTAILDSVASVPEWLSTAGVLHAEGIDVE